MTPVMPEGRRVYAIGDIHGRLDLLDDLLAKIRADEDTRGGPAATLIFLGDLVDRGPNSAQVVERLFNLNATHGNGRTRFLLGNHEEVFIAALDGDAQALKLFTKIGGRETILSYGLGEAEYRDFDYTELLAAVRCVVPQHHIDFLSSFEDLIVFGDYAFVHAGVRPGAPLARQSVKDLRWIRNEFLSYRGEHEKVVVHGHSITEEVEQLPYRIGLDTGAYASGKLTAMGFEGRDRWILQTAPPS